VHNKTHPVAKFVVLTGGITLGCRTGPPGYIGWRASMTTLCRSQLYPPVRDYEFGYCMVKLKGYKSERHVLLLYIWTLDGPKKSGCDLIGKMFLQVLYFMVCQHFTDIFGDFFSANLNLKEISENIWLYKISPKISYSFSNF
jgi:hypothetical protein